MKTFKKVLALLLVAALAAGLAIVGTVAYLTHEDEEVNVFTVGNVEVELVEQQRDNQQNPTKLVDFEQNKGMMPVVGSISTKDTTYGIPNPSNYVDKIVYARNVGASAAYMRIRVAVPTFENTTDTPDDPSTNNLHWNYVGDATRTKIQAAIGADKFDDAAVSAPVKTGPIVIDGQKYNVYTFTYAEPIAPKMNSGIIMCGLYLDERVDYNPDSGKYEDINGKEFEIPNNTVYIPVIVEAIQADGFASAELAFTAANFPENPWAELVSADTADALIEALENGKDVILTNDVKIDPAGMSNAYGTTGINVKNGQTIDGNGNTLDIKGAGGTWDSGICTTGGIIRDITVTGSFRGIFINHNSTHSERVVLENVTIEGTTYTISCDQGLNQGLTATNSTFKGWTSYAATLGDAKFIDCNFGEGSGYAYCRPYAPTEFVGCDFEAGFTVDPRAAVTFVNCTLNGVPLTADNISDLVTNTSNVTVK